MADTRPIHWVDEGKPLTLCGLHPAKLRIAGDFWPEKGRCAGCDAVSLQRTILNAAPAVKALVRAYFGEKVASAVDFEGRWAPKVRN